MSNWDNLREAIENLKSEVVVPATADAPVPVQDAQKYIDDEKKFYADRHQADMQDRNAARGQRKVYARSVFILVCVWIAAIYALLVFQVFGTWMNPQFRPLSDAVLIALISSTTVNLIGTLIIVLKYIFRVPGPNS